jgi:hypothetical protein
MFAGLLRPASARSCRARQRRRGSARSRQLDPRYILASRTQARPLEGQCHSQSPRRHRSGTAQRTPVKREKGTSPLPPSCRAHGISESEVPKVLCSNCELSPKRRRARRSRRDSRWSSCGDGTRHKRVDPLSREFVQATPHLPEGLPGATPCGEQPSIGCSRIERYLAQAAQRQTDCPFLVESAPLRHGSFLCNSARNVARGPGLRTTNVPAAPTFTTS